MAFIPWRKASSSIVGDPRLFIITNSSTIVLGDMVVLTSGFATRVAAGANRMVGAVIGFYDRNGLPLDANSATTVTGTRSGTAGSFGSESYAAASDNQTVDKVMVMVDCNPMLEYLDTAVSGVTLAQSNVGQYCNVTANANHADGSGLSNTYGSLQLVLTKIDPVNDGSTAKGIFKIVLHAWTA